MARVSGPAAPGCKSPSTRRGEADRARDARGQSRLSPTTAAALVHATRLGTGKDVPPERQQKNVRILTMDGDMASVRLVSTKLVDYMHLARWNGEWKIVNVLWDFRPGARPKP